MTTIVDHLLAEGFTSPAEGGSTRTFYNQANNVTVLVGDHKVRIAFKYPSNGYWRLTETAEFPNTKKFLPAICAAVSALCPKENRQP